MKPEDIKVGMEFVDRGNGDRIIVVKALESGYAYVVASFGVGRAARVGLHRLCKRWKYALIGRVRAGGGE